MPSKPTLSARQLQALLQERINAIPELQGVLTDIQAGGVIWMDPGHEGGPNWTVRRVSNQENYRTDIARIIRDVQREYDLDTD